MAVGGSELSLFLLSKRETHLSVMALAPRFKYTTGESVRELDSTQLQMKNQIEEKIREGTYTLKKYPCTVCGESHFELLSEKGRYGIQIPVKICLECGLIQTNPRFDEESAQKFYENEYRQLYNLASPQERFENQYNRSQDIFQYLQRGLDKEIEELTVLEIGCGYGGMLKYFQEQGCDVIGCDLDKDVVQFAQSKELTAVTADVRGLSLEKNPDIIILDDVLEHLINPGEVLSYISGEYPIGTSVYIEFPGVKRLGVFNKSYDCDFLQYIHIAHTHHFTLTTLNNLMKSEGYGIITGNEQVQGLFEISNKRDNYYISDYDSAIDHISQIERYRWVHQLYRQVWYLRKPHHHPILIKLLKRIGLYHLVKNIYQRIF